jgi:hypothetical protein
MDFCLLCVVCCQVEVMRQADHSSRGVLPTVARRVVCDQGTSWHEEAIARAGLQSQRK